MSAWDYVPLGGTGKCGVLLNTMDMESLLCTKAATVSEPNVTPIHPHINNRLTSQYLLISDLCVFSSFQTECGRLPPTTTADTATVDYPLDTPTDTARARPALAMPVPDTPPQ